jgi:hypothetical protein
MVTIGIDVASQPKSTAACEISWGTSVDVGDPEVGLQDDDVLRLIARADRVGLDVPLGGPRDFVAALAQHAAGHGWPTTVDPKQLTHRATDRFIWEKIGRWPLSVSADKIAIPAMRVARLLGALKQLPDRAGSGVVVEVYPAAALRAWGFNPEGYKGRSGQEIRDQLVSTFLEETRNWVTVSPVAQSGFVNDDNRFDAFVASLVARAWTTGRCWPVPPEAAHAARVEGWIALPKPGTLSGLSLDP